MTNKASSSRQDVYFPNLVVHRPRIQSTQIGSFLKRLPAEVRNTIYELVLISNDPIYVFIARPGRFPVPGYDDRVSLAITKTCKQIRSEALPIYFRRNSFVIPDAGRRKWYRKEKRTLTTTECGLQELHDFLHGIGPTARLSLASLRFDYGLFRKQDYQWTARAFELLGECTHLEKLEIGVNWWTTFGGRKPQMDLRLARGIKSLLAVVRGLKKLDVVVNDRRVPFNPRGILERPSRGLDRQTLRELEQLLRSEVGKDWL